MEYEGKTSQTSECGCRQRKEESPAHPYGETSTRNKHPEIEKAKIRKDARTYGRKVAFRKSQRSWREATASSKGGRRRRTSEGEEPSVKKEWSTAGKKIGCLEWRRR